MEWKSIMAHISSIFIIISLFLINTDSALAQAFTLQKGEARVISTFEYTLSDKAFDDTGSARDIQDYDQYSVYVNAEYGLTDDLTLFARPSYRALSGGGNPSVSGIEHVGLGARYRFVNSDGYVVSAEASWRISGNKHFYNLPQTDVSGDEYEVRLQAAKGATQGFAIVDLGYRARSGAAPNEFHIDATAGIRVAPKFHVIINSANTYSDGRGKGIYTNKYHYNDLFLSGAYQLSKHVTLQVGVRSTIAGRNALRQRGAFAGLWAAF